MMWNSIYHCDTCGFILCQCDRLGLKEEEE